MVNYKIFLTQAQADAQALVEKLGEYAVTYHPPLSEDFERFKEGYKGVEKIEWANPATYRKPKPKKSSRAILTPLGAVMMMREYYEN